MKKLSGPRIAASLILSALFLGELYLVSNLLNSYGTASLAVGHLLCVYGIFVLPVLAVLIAMPCYENASVKMAVNYGGILYACCCGLMYNAASMLYANGLAAASQTPGYYVVGAKVIGIVLAIVLASFEVKAKKEKAPEEVAAPAAEVVAADDCCEACSEELTEDEAAMVDSVIK